MKKKFLGALLSFLLIFLCAFNLTACASVPPADPIGDADKLTATEWTNLLNTTDFSLMQGYSISMDSDSKGFMLDFYGDDYKVFNQVLNRDPNYDENDSNQNHDNYYRKNISGVTTTYQRVVKYFDTDTLKTTWETNSINKNKYDSNVKDVLDLITYVKNNQSKFTAGNYNVSDGKLPGYKLNIAGSEVETTINNILTLMGLGSRLVDFIFVHKSSSSLSVVYGTNDIITISFNCNRVSAYDFKLITDSIKNNTKMTTGDTADSSYSIFHVTDAGYHTEYPNHPDTNTHPKHIYAEKQNNDSYLAYVKVNGEWTTMLLNDYESTLEASFRINTGNIENKQDYFYWGENKIYIKDSYTYTEGGVTYTYSDVVINIDENNNVTSMTWTVTSPNAVENKTITPTNDTITFPVVE